MISAALSAGPPAVPFMDHPVVAALMDRGGPLARALLLEINALSDAAEAARESGDFEQAVELVEAMEGAYRRLDWLVGWR